MGSGKTSFDSKISTNSTDRSLLEIYQRYVDESQRKDNFNEKIDKHLKELIYDRHELDAEVLRRGEKISNLQKALIDLQLSCFDERERFHNVTIENEKLKKSYEKLLEGLHSLLNLTKDTELRDQIFNILQHSKVKIDARYDPKAASSSTSRSHHRRSIIELLKEQIQSLKAKIKEYSKVSKSKIDSILEDCKLALEKSRGKLLQNEQEINFFKKKLQEVNNQVSKAKQIHFDQHGSYQNYGNSAMKFYSSPSKLSSSDKKCEVKTNISTDSIRSVATNMHLTLVMLSKVLDKVSYLLNSIQVTQVFSEIAKLPKSPMCQAYVNEQDVTQLQGCIRHCTRLSFDINNLWKSLNDHFSSEKIRAMYINIESDVKDLAPVVEELATTTAETDLLFVSLYRENFFDYLIKPKARSDKFGLKKTSNQVQYVFDVFKTVVTVKSTKCFVSQAEKIVERIIQKYDGLTYIKLDQTNYILSKNSEQMSNINNSQEPKNLHLTEPLRSENYFPCETPQKIDWFSISAVKNKLGQFSEYSAFTFNKLETLAKHSRDAVNSAEAQITSLQNNTRLLSKKLMDAEELVRESVCECLTLKQKLQVEQLHREISRARLSGEPWEKFYKTSDFEFDTVVNEVDRGIYTKKESKISGPFECLYCKQGSHHKFCIEKIKELTANNRKISTELKLLQQEMKEEKKVSKMNQEQAVRATRDIGIQEQDFKKTLLSLESKNASLIEQLKIERNRLRKMERFHRLEIEGFQTDIKNLKAKILDLEKQLMKAVLIFEHDKKDLELLKTVQTTAQHSMQAIGAVRRLKAKLYEIETDIKNL
ncbi:hypothetical protein TNIN_2401 [Trichonephila inaurata madagascariensis]|uniref:Uncharacterized protein n=1 Tax=Trichonephila inaurata madagascariensis TaxID=2747483 RepID=A0A8X6XDC7_9ARAC|nr:hypothetical protein TNIN_2401 [Trichonephila inaurata madagascariensis]